jgi:hypothetical protein
MTAPGLRTRLRLLNGTTTGDLGPISALLTGPDGDESATQEHYQLQMRSSHFILAPRGDRIYTYRMVEAMAMGMVPIVIADGYVFPFEGTTHARVTASTRPFLPPAYVPGTLCVLFSLHVPSAYSSPSAYPLRTLCVHATLAPSLRVRSARNPTETHSVSHHAR